MARVAALALFAALGFLGMALIAAGAWQVADQSGLTISPRVEPVALATDFPTVTTLPSVTPHPAISMATHLPTVTPTRRATATLRPAFTLTPTSDSRLVCPNAPLTRLIVGDRAYVSYEPPEPNRVRAEPNTHAYVLGKVYPGDEVIILDGPACANNWVWWKVRAVDNTTLEGWTAEGDFQNYWLVPMP